MYQPFRRLFSNDIVAIHTAIIFPADDPVASAADWAYSRHVQDVMGFVRCPPRLLLHQRKNQAFSAMINVRIREEPTVNHGLQILFYLHLGYAHRTRQIIDGHGGLVGENADVQAELGDQFFVTERERKECAPACQKNQK